MYPYAKHKDTGIWCLAWAFDDEQPEIWTPPSYFNHDTLPQRVREHIRAGGEIRAWNAQFERVIWNNIMVPRYGAPPIALEQWHCTAAEAAAMALPRSLDQAAIVCKTGAKKDQEGYGLMMRMTRPRSINADGTPVWWDVPERIQRLAEYCKQDVRTERGLFHALRRLTPKEREVYLLDQRMNDRGIPVDVALVRAAQEIVNEGVERAEAALSQITGGEVTGIKDHGALRKWVNEQGVNTESVGKPAVAELLESDLSPEVRQALLLRVSAGGTSTSKLKSMIDVADPIDSRARGLVLYHGASTGRWTGKLLQPHNFPRGLVKDVDDFIDAVLAGSYDFIDLFYHPIVVVSAMLRAMLRSAPGHDLIAGDYAAIEARVLNWLAGQDDVLAAFRAMDAGDKTKHPYKIMAVAMGRAKTPADVIKPSEDYQAGKAAELGCGYQMGAKKFTTAAWDVYQVRVTDEQAKVAVDAYRSTHEKVVDFWWATQNACMEAVRHPGAVQIFGGRKNLKAIKAGAYLYIILPSGRPLCYAAPAIEQAYPPWAYENDGETGVRKLKSGAEKRDTLTFWSSDPKYGWCNQRTYGGHLVENIVQAVARDLLAEGKLRLEEAGYLPLMSVHDEAICEIPKDFGSLEEFERLLATTPAWAAGCPVAAEAWRGERYRK